FFKKIVKIKDLCESIRDSYFFPREPLELWFGVEKKKGVDQVHAFHRSGEVTFKGFEASPPIVIFEIIDIDGPFFKTLTSNHFKQWYNEALEAQKESEAEAETETEAEPLQQ
ncbi:MAG: hypothetical protein V3T30_06475, partial [Thermodesulfobacteriota bacterium]